MVRRTRIAVLVAVTSAGILSGAALAPAAGDRHVTGAPAELSHTEDGVPYVRTGPECKAGSVAAKRRHDRADASDF